VHLFNVNKAFNLYASHRYTVDVLTPYLKKEEEEEFAKIVTTDNYSIACPKTTVHLTLSGFTKMS
jgi:hypothetical protein